MAYLIESNMQLTDVVYISMVQRTGRNLGRLITHHFTIECSILANIEWVLAHLVLYYKHGAKFN